MRITSTIVIVLLSAAAASGQTLGAVLTIGQSVPPIPETGLYGNATVTFDETRRNITVLITAHTAASTPTGIHIHEAAAGANGPAVVEVTGFNPGTFSGFLSVTVPIAAEVASRILQSPSNFYLDMHSNHFPGGTATLRGQLSFAAGDRLMYAASMRPATTSATEYGSALVTLDPFNESIAWDVAMKSAQTAALSHLHRAPVGTSGPAVLNFATSASQFSGNRTSGSGAISALQTAAFAASDLAALATASSAAGYYVDIETAGGGGVRGQLMPAYEYDIPIAGRVTNALGQTFVTDVRIVNHSFGSSTTALVEYFATGTTANATATASMSVTLRPRETAILDDIGGTAGLNIAGTTGAIRVTSPRELAVTSRIYADLRAAGKGTQGQFVPAPPRSSALRRGLLPQLSHSTDLSTGYRTNIGYFNPTSGTVWMRIEAREFDGTLLEWTRIEVPALSQVQKPITSYFVSFTNKKDVTVSFDASAPVFVYAAVNDNVSADSILVPAQRDAGERID